MPRAKGLTGLHPSSFRKEVGIGKFEFLGKYAIAEFTDGVRHRDAAPELPPEHH